MNVKNTFSYKIKAANP